MPSSCSISQVSGRLLLRSLGTIGFRDVTGTNGREKPSQKRTAHLFCAARQTRVIRRQHEMFETAAEYNFDTVSDAAKDKIKILLSSHVNDDVLYDPFSIDFSSYGYIPTEHFNRRVYNTLSLKTLGDGNCFGNLELRDLDRQESTWYEFLNTSYHTDCRFCFIYELYKLF